MKVKFWMGIIMAKPSGFIEYKRKEEPHRDIKERVRDYNEVLVPLRRDELEKQAARCMDCGIPFCHGFGCPLGNKIPEFNDYVYKQQWRQACEVLHSTNNFPEITGRVCPAPCEASCTLNVNDNPVLIRHIEYQIVEMGFANGWIKALTPNSKTGKKVAVIGSGPAGLAAAEQLVRYGHEVEVFEKSEKPGGLLRYGIPDFKLNKKIIDRRLDLMRQEGVKFQTGVVAGEDISARYLRKMYDAVCLTMGAGEPRGLTVPGSDFSNVVFALDYLRQQNIVNDGGMIDPARRISAEGKVVVVIGGGDTGSDCVGTACRQGAKEIYQYEIMPQPPAQRSSDTPWPWWPNILRTSTSQEEAGERRWCILTKELKGSDGLAKELHGIQVQWQDDGTGRKTFKEVPGSEFVQKVDLVLLAMGFVHVQHSGLVSQMGLELDGRGNIKTDNYATSEQGVFAAGDAGSGASLVVRAINSGRKAAVAIDDWLS